MATLSLPIFAIIDIPGNVHGCHRSMRQRAGSVGVGFLAVCAMVILTWGCQSVPEPGHRIVSQGNGYEIREYEGYVVAEVVMSGAWRDALYGGFRILFDYIQGNNEGRAKVAMTAPVLSGRPEKIAMTSPVLQEAVPAPPEEDGRRRGPPGPGESERHAIAFIAPAEFTVETMPLPKDPRIRIRAIPPHKAAVLRYGGWTNADKVRKRTDELRAILARDGWKPASEFRSAQYNPPWTPPPFRRNEIIVEIEREGMPAERVKESDGAHYVIE